MAAAYAGELERRKAVLRRFRELLVEQRSKFQDYLVVLDHEKEDIASSDVDRLASHVEVEAAIVSEIFTFQKVIDPLEDLYREAYPAAEAQGHDILGLKGAITELQTEVLKRNAENRGLLKQRMEILRHEMLSLKKPLASRRSVYATQGEGGLLDISG
jgi:hypothetical protein